MKLTKKELSDFLIAEVALENLRAMRWTDETLCDAINLILDKVRQIVTEGLGERDSPRSSQ